MMKDDSLLLELLKLIHPRPWPVYYVYDIPTDPERTIQFVNFDYDCRSCLKAFAWLCVDCESTDIRYFTEAPCNWKLNRKVRHLKLIANTPLVSDCLHTEVVYEEPEVWIPVAPGASYPLPDTPPEISRITFEAKTDTGTTSMISVFLDGFALMDEQVTSSPKTLDWSIGGPYPVEDLSLTNTGISTIYIRNLTTESVWGTPYAPGESIPLPEFPQEISKITFEAQTGAGTTSVIELFLEGSSFIQNEVSSSLETFDWNLGGTVPVAILSMNNTGGSTVYIRNLTTE